MSAIVLQRYLLVASSAVTAIPASGTQLVTAATANVPLGSHWTIRFRKASAILLSSDNSGSLTIDILGASWLLQNPQGTAPNLFVIDPVNSIITPPFAFPKLSGVPVAVSWDADQTVSSLDQVGGVIGLVNCTTQAIVTNTDAANPHSLQAFVRAILEFETVGSNE